MSFETEAAEKAKKGPCTIREDIWFGKLAGINYLLYMRYFILWFADMLEKSFAVQITSPVLSTAVQVPFRLFYNKTFSF
jgi:hypothetical protein